MGKGQGKQKITLFWVEEWGLDKVGRFGISLINIIHLALTYDNIL